MATTSASSAPPESTGILALEVYIPKCYVSQSELESHVGVPAGKFTIGLGQDGIAVIGDREDVNSVFLTVASSLLSKYGISEHEIGRLEVGTETLIDKSKSSKTTLMTLFPTNRDIEGVTSVNACYGGTSALLNAFSWVSSPSWDGRYALVVCGDIAGYAPGPARPSGGGGAAAMLVGRGAALRADLNVRASYSEDVYDFYKPDHSSEYPTVDGPLSQQCYTRALEGCYSKYADKSTERLHSQLPQTNDTFSMNTPDFFLFHSPYAKLVQKSFAHLFSVDSRRLSSPPASADEINAAFIEKVHPSTLLSRNCGNAYTASLYFGLASLLSGCSSSSGDSSSSSSPTLSSGSSILMFSYGSGCMSTLFRLEVCSPPNPEERFSLAGIRSRLDLQSRLEARTKLSPAELDGALRAREMLHQAKPPFTPVYGKVEDCIWAGAYYLTGVDDKWRRSYAQVQNQLQEIPRNPPRPTLPEQPRCVITGTSAGLPGCDPVFAPDNLCKLSRGENLITALPLVCRLAMLGKNVVQVKRPVGGGPAVRLPVVDESGVVKLAAQLGAVDLVKDYGVAKGLADAMDVASKVAVAAGLEALKDAGLVRGDGDWTLAEELRDSTGVVYASSFPALDAAVGEVTRFFQGQTVSGASTEVLVDTLRRRLCEGLKVEALGEEDEAALARLCKVGGGGGGGGGGSSGASTTYEFDRKFLFRVLVLGNAQLAQIVGCRGPNTQTNAACAGTTQAIAMAQDMLTSGRCERVVVVAGDNASGPTLMPWVGSGFRALGAAALGEKVEEAAMPFDKRRSGMLLGAGGIGIVLETEASALARRARSAADAAAAGAAGAAAFKIKARLVATQYSNSAFHGAALDRRHVAQELSRFLKDVGDKHGVTKEDIVKSGVYFSHETSTHASSETSCAANEVAALRAAFGEELVGKLLICNTKGFTGHPMGVSFEDVAAIEVLVRQVAPPVVNFLEKDEALGDLRLSKGGAVACKYALRFAAGFGSQVSFALYAVY